MKNSISCDCSIVSIHKNIFGHVSKTNSVLFFFNELTGMATTKFECFQRHVVLLIISIVIRRCNNATKYWMCAIFKEKELASSLSILQKANILRY